MADVEVVWRGSDALRPFLVPLFQLEPFPDNPRRGDVGRLRESLRRFGQVLPALADPALGTDGRMRLVARHHLALAAGEEGWTHFAVVSNDFGGEGEARAYLLADNLLGQLGGYDVELLHAQVERVRALGFAGTGMTPEDADELKARVAGIAESFRPAAEPPPRLDQRGRADAGFEVVLRFRDHSSPFPRHVALLKREWGVQETTDVVERAVREAAERAATETT